MPNRYNVGKIVTYLIYIITSNGKIKCRKNYKSFYKQRQTLKKHDFVHIP